MIPGPGGEPWRKLFLRKDFIPIVVFFRYDIINFNFQE